MRIIAKNAANLFFPNTSLEFVYYEAIANALDAGASTIQIIINIGSFSEVNTFELIIEDDGCGFDDSRFRKFTNILDVDDKHHKGVGRLVYLNYFNKIKVESNYGKQKRTFLYNADFDGESDVVELNKNENGTKIVFSEYLKAKIQKYDYVVAAKVRSSIVQHFLPIFYKMKLEKKPLTIKISVNAEVPNDDHNFYSDTQIIDITKLPTLKEKVIPDSTKLFGEFKMLYSIETTQEMSSAICALCADNRTVPMQIISNKNVPAGYKLVFILYSDYFDGKSNTTREGFDLDEALLKRIKLTFTQMVSDVIKEEIPEIAKRNEKTQEAIQNQYPHLVGYFDESAIGLAEKAAVVQAAQERYFHDQKEILEASELSDSQYEQSINFSSRALTEYVLYRTKIINKLKLINVKDNESEIHNLIVPKKKILKKCNGIEHIYYNNAWVLDDKFMSYGKVLSDVEVEQIYKELDVKGSHAYSDVENGRPDITIIFSDSPATAEKVDVIVIELKKLGLDLAKKEEIYSQLKQRARRLLEFYPSKIQRIWFYGIIDFDNEFKASLIENGYVMLYSSGDMFYKSQEIVLNMQTLDKKYADIFLLSYSAMLDDAESRNQTFLSILKDGIKHFSKSNIK